MEAPATDAPGKSQPKALKFVTNYGQPQVKRRRIGAACLTCRKRKTACSGERPACETCAQNRLDCAGYSADASHAPGHKRTASERGQREGKTDAERRTASGHQPEFKQEDGIDPSLQPRPHAQTVPAHLMQSQWSSESLPEAPQQDAPSEPTGNGKSQPSLFSGPRNRMPYFRWLGPTAISPGFKQMVVKVKRQDNDMGRSSTNGDGLSGLAASPAVHDGPAGVASSSQQRLPPGFSGTPGAVDGETRTPLNLPFYDTSPMPPSELITHLAETFFSHLGCNYPFLQRERFMRDLEEKQVDAILVDAVCALAARFSTHTLLTQQSSDDSQPSPAEYGHAFAQRAKTALVDTYSCPSVAAVQAALLLAYLEFGESRDSGLWMYLGISIRMAQDLGMHKLEGLRYRGMSGPTPKMIKRESISNPKIAGEILSDHASMEKARVADGMSAITARENDEGIREEAKQIEEQKSVEQERVDTFWAVFFLDRVVSSGTGRRCMLRDKDIEISFPALDEKDARTGWPAPFPAVIRIVHLYGRVSDLLNSIKEPSDITTETTNRLASMESQVTNLYQGLSSKLHFDAVNFQHYMKAGEGTNFVLLHFWFHLLIVLLHQPTLLKTFKGRMLQLFPNSQQLSMSSAKTIADILSYSQLMDAKASLGNPFTSQPIYIAACAFLKETAEQTATSSQQSRCSSPTSGSKGKEESQRLTGSSEPPPAVKRMSISALSNSNSASTTPDKPPDAASKVSSAEQRAASAPKHANAIAKHTLLATAATQHYQLCYKALQSLETYWSGTKYILTVLDQKFEGVRDPLLYTVEEGESAMEQPRPEPAFTSPGWRRKASWGQYLSGNAGGLQSDLWGGKSFGQVVSEGGNGDPSKAIGWTITGTLNSPSTNLAWHYPSGSSGAPAQHQQQRQPQQAARPAFNPITNQYDPQPPQPHFQQMHTSSNGTVQAVAGYPAQQSHTNSNNNDTPTASDADLLLNLHSPYATTNTQSSTSNTGGNPVFPPHYDPNQTNLNSLSGANWNYASFWHPLDFSQDTNAMPFGDMMIESRDVDMSMLGLDMMPWCPGGLDGFEGQGMVFAGDGRQVGSGGGGEGGGGGERASPDDG